VNAVKFTHPSGRISIKLEHTNKQAILTVADNWRRYLVKVSSCARVRLVPSGGWPISEASLDWDSAWASRGTLFACMAGVCEPTAAAREKARPLS
jgi:hypothetical protein